MMMLLLACCGAASAEDTGAPPESSIVQPKPATPGGLSFLGQFQTRTGVSNLDSTNPFLDGQVIGRMGGTNGVLPAPGVLGVATEERAGGFFSYAPKSLAGKAGLTAAFEIDFAWGDRSYGTGGNTGGGFGGDQVNLQTRRLYADFRPSKGGHDAHVLVGLQFVGDSVNDPTAGGPDGVLRSGGRLMFFGSEAAGIGVYGRIHDDWGDRVRYRLGSFTLYEQGLALPDDAWLNVADLQWSPAYLTTIGVHGWYLQDRTGGAAGALGAGATSALSELQGGPHLDLYDGQPPPADAQLYADLGWLGLDAAYDPSLLGGPVGVSGVAMLNLGRIYAPIVHDDTIRGVLIDAELRARIAPGRGSLAKVEGLFSTGDDANPDVYTGVVTGNSYGIAGAVHATHGMYLLFPDPHAINRMVAVVSDVSGAGQGVIGITGTLGYDPIPDRLNVTAGVGHASTAAGQSWGTELNAKVTATPLLFCDVSGVVSTVFAGPASGLTTNPWAAYVAVDFLVF
jgi:hypothetical protein